MSSGNGVGYKGGGTTEARDGATPQRMRQILLSVHNCPLHSALFHDMKLPSHHADRLQYPEYWSSVDTPDLASFLRHRRNTVEGDTLVKDRAHLSYKADLEQIVKDATPDSANHKQAVRALAALPIEMKSKGYRNFWLNQAKIGKQKDLAALKEQDIETLKVRGAVDMIKLGMDYLKTSADVAKRLQVKAVKDKHQRSSSSPDPDEKEGRLDESDQSDSESDRSDNESDRSYNGSDRSNDEMGDREEENGEVDSEDKCDESDEEYDDEGKSDPGREKRDDEVDAESDVGAEEVIITDFDDEIEGEVDWDDIYDRVEAYREKIPEKKCRTNPLHFYIIDYTGQHQPTQDLFGESFEVMRELVSRLIPYKKDMLSEEDGEFLDKVIEATDLESIPAQTPMNKQIKDLVRLLKVNLSRNDINTKTHHIIRCLLPFVDATMDLPENKLYRIEWGENELDCCPSRFLDDCYLMSASKCNCRITCTTVPWVAEIGVGHVTSNLNYCWPDKMKMMHHLRDMLIHIEYNLPDVAVSTFPIFGWHLAGYHLKIYALITKWDLYHLVLVHESWLPSTERGLSQVEGVMGELLSYGRMMRETVERIEEFTLKKQKSSRKRKPARSPEGDASNPNRASGISPPSTKRQRNQSVEPEEENEPEKPSASTN